MMILKQLKFELFNDGILEYGNITSAFNEATRKKTGETFTVKGTLYFGLDNARESDLMIAQNLGYSIDYKIRVPKNDTVSSKDKVRIDGTVYDIKRNETNKQTRYLYLQKVGV